MKSPAERMGRALLSRRDGERAAPDDILSKDSLVTHSKRCNPLSSHFDAAYRDAFTAKKDKVMAVRHRLGCLPPAASSSDAGALNFGRERNELLYAASTCQRALHHGVVSSAHGGPKGPNCTIHVKGSGGNFNENGLWKHFRSFGAIRRVTMRGSSAWVEFENYNGFMNALENGAHESKEGVVNVKSVQRKMDKIELIMSDFGNRKNLGTRTTGKVIEELIATTWDCLNKNREVSVKMRKDVEEIMSLRNEISRLAASCEDRKRRDASQRARELEQIGRKEGEERQRLLSTIQELEEKVDELRRLLKKQGGESRALENENKALEQLLMKDMVQEAKTPSDIKGKKDIHQEKDMGEVFRMSKEVKKYKSVSKHWKNKLEDVAEKLETAVKERDEAVSMRNEDLEKTRENKRAVAEDMSKREATLKAEMGAEIDRLEKEKTKREATLKAEMGAEIDRLERDLDDASKAVDAKEDELNDAVELADFLVLSENAKMSEIDEWKAKDAEKQREIDYLKAKVEALEKKPSRRK
jgi:hypothetical protein